MPAQLPDQFRHDIQAILPLIITNGLNVVAAIFILIVGFWIAGWAHSLVLKTLGRAPNVDEMLKGFFGSIVRYLILTLTFLSVLSQFGFQTTSLIAVLGAAGLAVGLALQGTLSNIAAGVMLLLFRPFKIGQTVDVGGIAGTVKELTLFTTELVTPDNVLITVPNASVWGHPIKNFSIHAEHPLSIRFRIAYAADFDLALSLLTDILANDLRCLKAPAPGVTLDQNTDGTIAVVASFWVVGDVGGALKTDLIKTVKVRFEAAGVPVPPPTA